MELYLNFKPFPVLETERLLLRELTTDDAESLFFFRTNPQVLQYIDREPMTHISEVSAFMQRIMNQQDANESIIWAIELKDQPGHLAGTITYWRLEKEHLRAEIGYQLHPDHWSKGLISEAMKAVIEFGFSIMNLHSIEANINPANSGSRRVLEKAGFIKEAYFRENYYFRGRFIDSEIYSLLNPLHSNIH